MKGMPGTFQRSQTLLIGLEGNWGGVAGLVSCEVNRQRVGGGPARVRASAPSRKGLFNESKVAAVSFRLGGYTAREMS